MKKINVIKSDLYRAICKKGFVLAVLAVVVLCCISVTDYVSWYDLSKTDLTYLFELFVGLTMFKKVIVVLAAASFAASFCNDWNYQYIRPTIIRTGVNEYIWSKVITCFISAFLTVFVGITLFVILGSFLIQLVSEATTIHPPFVEVFAISPALYLFTKIFVFSLGCAFWVVCGLAISAYIPNRFVAILTPLIASYFLEEITINFRYLGLYSLTRVYDVLEKGPVLGFLYYVFIFAILSLFAGLAFSWQVKRRIRNEVV